MVSLSFWCSRCILCMSNRTSHSVSTVCSRMQQKAPSSLCFASPVSSFFCLTACSVLYLLHCRSKIIILWSLCSFIPPSPRLFFYLYFVSVVSKVCFNLNSTLCSFFVFVDIYVNQEFHTIHKIHFKHGASLTSLCLLLFCCWEAWMVSLKTFCRWCAACFLKSLPYYICISIRQKVVFTA